MDNSETPNSPAPGNPAAPRCPRQAQRKAAMAARATSPRVVWADWHEEPFRCFFPVAVLAGIVGVALWPVVLSGWMTDYPGVRHARLMVQGFFGGFMIGFLGTAFPRFLEVRALRATEVFPLWFVFCSCIGAHALGATGLGDGLFIVTALALAVILGGRLRQRLDVPPPGFVLVALGFAIGLAGLGLMTWAGSQEAAAGWEALGRLWAYHCFVLLAILGAGGFLLPRFLGLSPRRKFATSVTGSPEWRRQALLAAGTGLLVAGSYVLETAGWNRWAGLLRAATVTGYLWNELPLERLRWSGRGVQWILMFGLASMPLGILAAAWWPHVRVGLSHIELVSGFGLITLGVGTRVIFGHSGQREQLERFHPWLTAAAVLMLLGMLSRVSGDFLPKSLASHYFSGALCWLAGMLIWAACVLPKILIADRER